jgi:putative tricarboxylic transport membrane protein
MMEHLLTSFADLFQPLTFLLLFLGTAAGILFGAIPGLSGGLGVTLVLPLTFGIKPTVGLALLIGVWIGGVSGGLIGSILLGIPGAPSSIATCFDGYPMTQKGEAVKALGAAIIASFIGMILSILIAAFLSPIIADLAIKLGPWEYFSLCFCAITLVAALSREDIFKGMAAAAIGLLLSSVGFSPIDGYPRFSFGINYIKGGLDLIAMMLGIFAIKQIVVDFGKGQQTMPELKTGKISGFGVTIKEFTDNAVNLIRSFLIGLWIGFLPGMGSGLSNMVAYAEAKRTSKHPEKFGTGIIDGVFASEISNNAAVGGAVIPMVALGIPGDGVTAVLLSGLMVHGIQPGPLLFTSNPDIVYTLFAGIMVTAVAVILLQFFGMRLFPMILKIPYFYLYPCIIVMCFVGAFTSTNTTFNLLLLLAFGLLGILMDIGKLPASPFILSFILGPMLESNLRKGMTYTDNGLIPFFTRPISGLLLLVAIASIVWPLIKDYIKKNKAGELSAAVDTSTSNKE